MTHSDIDHRVTRCGIAFVVLAVPPVAPQPTEGSLHDPTLWQHNESFDLCWSQYGLQQPSKGLLHTLGQVVPVVSAVGKDHLQPVESGLQSAKNRQNQYDSVVILDIRRMDDDRQDQPERIHNDMSLASVDLFAGVVTPLAADFGRLDRLTVDNRSTGRPLAAHGPPKHVPERVVNLLPSSIVAPPEKDSVNGLPIGEFVGKKSPGATAAEEVQDRVDDRTTAHRLRSTSARGPRQEFSKDLPLLVGQVRGIVRQFRVGHRYDSFRSVAGNRRLSYRFLLI